MFRTTFVFSDEIFCNFKMTIRTSTMKWSEAIIITNMWITAKFTDEILHNSQVAITSSCM